MSPHRGRAEFVARGPELASLHAALADAASGSPSVVIVGADAGVGKTRLLQEFAAAVDGTVLWGARLPMGDRGLPLAPVAEALRDLPARAAPADQLRWYSRRCSRREPAGSADRRACAAASSRARPTTPDPFDTGPPGAAACADQPIVT